MSNISHVLMYWHLVCAKHTHYAPTPHIHQRSGDVSVWKFLKYSYCKHQIGTKVLTTYANVLTPSLRHWHRICTNTENAPMTLDMCQRSKSLEITILKHFISILLTPICANVVTPNMRQWHQGFANEQNLNNCPILTLYMLQVLTPEMGQHLDTKYSSAKTKCHSICANVL